MKYNFEVDKARIVEENSNSQFATVEIDVCRTGNNSHRLNISKEALVNSASSVKGKPILAAFRRANTDFGGHDADEVPVGFFEEVEPELVERDGEFYIRAIGKIWKKYFENAMDIFKRKNGKTDVSMETELLEGEEPTNFSDGRMDLFSIMGCTLLGVAPSIKGSEARVLSFSELKENYNKEESTLNKLQEFSNERRNRFLDDKNDYVSHPLNTSKDAVDMGDWDGEKAKKDLVKEKRYETIGKTVCLDFQGGDRTQANCKYPVMNLKDGEWVYNAEGISSARGYSKDKDEKVYNKAISLQKKLGLYKNDEDKGDEKKMDKKEFSQLEGREIYEDVIERVHKKLGNHYYVEEIYSDHIEVRDMRTKEMLDIPAKIKVGKDDEEPSIEIDYDHMKKSGEQKQFAKKDKKMDDDEDRDEDDDVEEDEEEGDEDVDKEDKKEKKEMKKKKMSSDGNVDPTAYAEMLKQEAVRNEKLVKEMEEKDNIIMNYEKELAELRKFKEDEEEKEKKMAVDKEMADVKECVDEKEFKDLKEEGMACKMSEIDGWKNKVKAIAFEKVKNGKIQTGNSIWRMAGISNETKTSNSLWD